MDGGLTGVESAVPGEAISGDAVDALRRATDLLGGLLRLVLRATGEPVLVTDHRKPLPLLLLRLSQPAPEIIWLLDNSRIANSRTRQLAYWTSRGLDNSRIPPATLRA